MSNIFSSTEAPKTPKKPAKKSQEKSQKIVVLLPAYDPDIKLVKFVDDLQTAGFDEIVVVDDGSKDECQKHFDAIADNVHMVRHAVNQGKGRALKTGLNYIKLTYKDDLLGVLSADCDGQHSVSAMLDCKDALIDHPDKIILGVRQFSKGHVPLPNLLGNLITVGVFLGITEMSFSDTQCGLRGFPAHLLNDMIETHGERFEYESNMLIDIRKKSIGHVEVPMDAIYNTDNHSSHFNKVKDSIMIYQNILKFALFPMLAGVIGFFFSYIYFMNLGCLAERNIILTYSAGALLSWLLLSFTIKNEKKRDIWLIILWVAASTGIFFLLFKWLFNYAAAWWLAALLTAPVSYGLYLKTKYGKKPKKVKYKKEKKK